MGDDDDDYEDEYEYEYDERAKKRQRKSQKDVVGSNAAAIKASGSIAVVLTHNLPIKLKTREAVLAGCGILIECEEEDVGSYHSTVIAPATLFHRDNQLNPHHIQVDVYLSDGKLYKGELLACDFHNNLAAIRIQSDFPFRPAILRGLDDVASIDLSEHLEMLAKKPFQRPNLSKILPGDEIIIVMRAFLPPYDLFVYSGIFSAYDFSDHDCKELYSVKHCPYKGDLGGAVVSSSGDIIGIMFDNSHFLPINIILRWWSYYESCREFCQPCHGVQTANLDAAHLGFLEKIRNKFPKTGTGVIVTNIVKDTPAYFSGIRPNDVIVKCDGQSVRSKMELFEKMWDSAGKSLEMIVLRVSDGERLNLSMIIANTTPDKFNRWEPPSYKLIKLGLSERCLTS